MPSSGDNDDEGWRLARNIFGRTMSGSPKIGGWPITFLGDTTTNNRRLSHATNPSEASVLAPFPGRLQ